MFAVDPEVIRVIGEWAQKAENDLVTATHVLKLGERCPTDTVCFHAQQCVEKYLKALLVHHELDFPRSHDLRSLLARLPLSARPDLTPEEQETLTRYATVTRYPGDYEAMILTEARLAVRIARRVRPPNSQAIAQSGIAEEVNPEPLATDGVTDVAGGPRHIRLREAVSHPLTLPHSCAPLMDFALPRPSLQAQRRGATGEGWDENASALVCSSVPCPLPTPPALQNLPGLRQ